jgi:hypothetical protein
MSKSLNILLIEDDAIEVMKFNRVVKPLRSIIKLLKLIMARKRCKILKVKEVTGYHYFRFKYA